MVEWAKPSNDLSSAKSPEIGLPVLSKDSLDFNQSADYLNRTKRFVIRIPVLEQGGELMLHPEGTPKAGQPIKTLDDGETPDRGIVFYNGKDSVWQAVRGNGNETLLITGVEDDQAELLDAKERELLNDRSSHTLETAKALLIYANNDLALIDAQPKKATSVEKEMGPIPGSCQGHMVVTKEESHQAIHVPSGFVFKDGPVEQTYPEGAVLITNGRHVWGVAKDVFVQWFKRSEDGQEIDLISLDEEFGGK